MRTTFPFRLLAALCLAAVIVGGLAPARAGESPSAAVPDKQKLRFNGREATAADREILSRFEAVWGVKVPAGDYWYDARSGAAGLWGGPTRGFLGPGLALGGGVAPAEASGGGNGKLTGVFINGREIHPLDAQGLASLFGQPPWPGKWWVDGQGNFGPEGGTAIGNLILLSNQRQNAAGSYYRSDVASGSSVFVGSGCTAVSGRTSPSNSDSSYSYYVGC